MKRVTKQMLIAAVILSLMIGMNVYGQRLENKKDIQSLGTVLNDDGTINTKTGVSGSFDPAGYSMTTNEKGEPVFVPTGGGSMFTEGNEDWDGQFGDASGVNGEIKALGSDAAGNLYVGGAFTSINNNTSLKYFAKWDPTNKVWSSIGTDAFNGFVDAILVDGSTIYVGGDFHNIGGLQVNHIAKWNGSTWQAMGNGVDDEVKTIAKDASGNIYAGGKFYSAFNTGGISVDVNYIAKWDGSAWSSLRSGLNYGCVNIIVANGDDLYVGGYFTQADNNSPMESVIPVNRLAKWGNNHWSPVGDGNNQGVNGGPNPQVNAILINGSDIYVGGQFTSAGLTSANSIAKFNTGNNTWYALGSGIMNGTEPGIVNDMHLSGSYVYVAGSFNTAGGNSYTNCALWWTGNSWSGFDLTINGLINDMHITSHGFLYYGGNFNTIKNVLYSKNLYASVGTNQTPWQSGLGINGSVYSIAVSGSDVYVGGSFTRTGNVITSNIAKWNGASWSALGTGLNSSVYAIAVSGSDVYVGGNFSDAGGNANADKIAKWNGSSWNALGNGIFRNVVYAIAVSGSDVYVGGNIIDAGGNSNCDNIAKWNGASWSALGTGLNSSVYAIAVSGSDVYVGGYFTDAGGNANADRIAKWNGSFWSAMGTGLNQEVRAIAVSGSDVYVGGNFWDAGGNINADRIAKWNGTAWSALGTGLNSDVRAIAVSGSDVYVCGGFSGNGIAKWNGTAWSALGSGLNNWSYTLAIGGSNLFVGGDFTTAGGKSSYKFGRYAINIAPVVVSPIPNYRTGQGFDDFAAANLSTVFSDANGDPLTYTVTTNGKVNAQIQGTTLIISYAGTWGIAIVTVTANDGEYSATDQFEVNVGQAHVPKTSGNDKESPSNFDLSQNFPNPFNPTTTIKYALKEDVKVSLKIYNSLGQEVRTLVNENQTAGFKEIMWDGKNNQGSAVPSGIYMYRLVAGSKFVKANKMTLVK